MGKCHYRLARKRSSVRVAKLRSARGVRYRLLGAGAVMAAAAIAAAVPGVAQASAPAQAQRQVTVMTQNLYLGADLTPLFTPGVDFVTAAAAVFSHVKQVDFPARAAKIAGEVAAHHPDLIGLQEVALWQVGRDCKHLGSYVDYQKILLAALARHRLSYRVVSSDLNFHVTVPLTGVLPGVGCAAFADHDVILARGDLPVSRLKLSHPQSAEFGSYPRLVPGVPNEMPVTVNVPGLGRLTVSIDRGWTSVDVKVRGKSFRFVDTHLEAYGPAGNPALFRNIQARLLAQHVIAPSPLPVIAVGDYNSDAAPVPDLAGAYGILTRAGLTDAWPLARHDHDPGYTSGQAADLNNIPSQIDHRIDLVLFTSGPVHAVAGSGVTVGNVPPTATIYQAYAVMAYSAATRQWLWPSDHAGVVVTLHLARP